MRKTLGGQFKTRMTQQYEQGEEMSEELEARYMQLIQGLLLQMGESENRRALVSLQKEY